MNSGTCPECFGENGAHRAECNGAREQREADALADMRDQIEDVCRRNQRMRDALRKITQIDPVNHEHGYPGAFGAAEMIARVGLIEGGEAPPPRPDYMTPEQREVMRAHTAYVAAMRTQDGPTDEQDERLQTAIKAAKGDAHE